MRFTPRIAIAGAAVLAAAIIAVGSAQTKPKLGIMVLKDQPGQDVPTTQIVNDWAQKNGVDVTINTVTFSVLETQVATTLQSGSGPDLVLLSNYAPYLYSNALLDVTDLADRLGKENGGWYNIAATLDNIDGTWRGLPTYLYMHLLLYRQDVLKKAGVGVPTTWTQFRTALEKVKANAPEIAPFGVAYGRSFDGQQFLLSLIWAYGGDVVTKDGKVVLNSPATVQALKYAVNLYKDGLTAPGLLSWNDSTNNQAILTGQIATTFNGYSAKAQAATDNPELYKNLGVTVYPAGSKGRYSFPTAFSYGIRKNTAHADLAKDLLYTLLRKDNFTTVVNTTKGAIGTPFKGFATLPVFKDPATGAAAHIQAIESARLLPPSRAAAEVVQQQIIIDMIADVLNNGMTAEQAVARAAKRIGDVYSNGR